ncbi:MAG: hypothetical protein EBS05_11455 [Proteobacteria bacterium]|nr:hypothetical protein [Pseudomonadota bacterium]
MVQLALKVRNQTLSLDLLLHFLTLALKFLLHIRAPNVAKLVRVNARIRLSVLRTVRVLLLVRVCVRILWLLRVTGKRVIALLTQLVANLHDLLKRLVVAKVPPLPQRLLKRCLVGVRRRKFRHPVHVLPDLVRVHL